MSLMAILAFPSAATNILLFLKVLSWCQFITVCLLEGSVSLTSYRSRNALKMCFCKPTILWVISLPYGQAKKIHSHTPTKRGRERERRELHCGLMRSVSFVLFWPEPPPFLFSPDPTRRTHAHLTSLDMTLNSWPTS